MIVFSCQHIAREFIISQDSPSNLIFSEDSLSINYIGTAHFKTEEAGEFYREGLLAGIKNDFPAAEMKLKAALKLEPENYNILVGLGNVYAYGDRLDEAVEYYEGAMAVSDSLYPGVFLGIAKVYAAQDEFEKALAALQYVIQIGEKEDYILQVITYYQLTGVKLALLDCAGAERSFNVYENLTKEDDRFNALKRSVFKLLVNCTGNELREEYRDPGTGKLLATAETLRPDLELGEKQWVTQITLFQNKSTGNEIVITKELFRDYLYKDFYNNSEIAASGITGNRDNTLYAITDLASTKGRNKARIKYKLEMEDENSYLEILEITYSHPEENFTETESTSLP